jgi:hypothetical protein
MHGAGFGDHDPLTKPLVSPAGRWLGKSPATE